MTTESKPRVKLNRPRVRLKKRSGNHNPKWTPEQLEKARAVLKQKQLALYRQLRHDKIYKRREYAHRAKLRWHPDHTTLRKTGVTRKLASIAHLKLEDLKDALMQEPIPGWKMIAVADFQFSYCGIVRPDRLVARRIVEIEAVAGTSKTSSIYRKPIRKGWGRR